jgi:uncharacterized protein with HEPN domain
VSDDRESRALAYIRECISFIERDVRADPQALDDIGRATTRSVMWSLFTMADATTKLSDELKARHPEIDRASIGGFRNVAAHVYERLQLQQVRAIVTEAPPPLRAVIEAELAGRPRDR